MAQVAVVTDSTANLPPSMVADRDVTVVPLYVVFGSERTERESDLADYPAFFEQLRSAETLPSTSQPSVGDFIGAYGPLLADGLEVVSVHISAGLSGTHGSALQAAQQLERDGKGGERIRVIDSSTVAGGLGLVVLAASAAAAGGATGEKVEQRVHAARAEMKMWFAVDTLEFFRRGGRIGAAGAWIGSTLRIKPILTVESELTPVERVRTSSRAFERLADYARQRHEEGADAWVVQHIASRDEAQRLADRCREIFGREPEFVSEIGPVIGTHAGPGLLGVGSLPVHMLE